MAAQALAHDAAARSWLRAHGGDRSDDLDVVRQVRDDLGASAPARIMWVANRGFTAAGSGLDLGVHGSNQYIIGAKL